MRLATAIYFCDIIKFKHIYVAHLWLLINNFPLLFIFLLWKKKQSYLSQKSMYYILYDVMPTQSCLLKNLIPSKSLNF